MNKYMTMASVGLVLMIVPSVASQLPTPVDPLDDFDGSSEHDEYCDGTASGSTAWCERDWEVQKGVEEWGLYYCPPDLWCEPTSGIMHNNMFDDVDDDAWAYFWHNFLDGSPISSCQEWDAESNGFTRFVISLTPDTTSECPDAQPTGFFGGFVDFYDDQSPWQAT